MLSPEFLPWSLGTLSLLEKERDILLCSGVQLFGFQGPFHGLALSLSGSCLSPTLPARLSWTPR